MTATPNTFPDITGPDVGVVLVSRWVVGSPERQRAAAEATLAAWEREPWPRALVSLNCYLSTDGQAVLTYAQWTSDEAHREYERAARPTPMPWIDDAVAGIERPEPVRYRLYRSFVSDGPPRVPGCIVVVDIEAEGPERGPRWVDFLFDVVGAESGPPPGLISAHFHISIDGDRVLNYAEWTDEEAHRAIASPAPAAVARIVDGVPGVRPVGFRRYRLHRSLVRFADRIGKGTENRRKPPHRR